MHFGELQEPQLTPGSQDCVATSSPMMNTRKACHIPRQVVWRTTPVWATPRSQQRPQAVPRLHGPFRHALARRLARLCTTAMTAALGRVTPRGATAGARVGSRLDTRTMCARGAAPQLARDVWAVCHQPHDDVPPALAHPDERRGLGCARAAATWALEPSALAASPVLTTAGGWPGCPATRAPASPAPWSRTGGGGWTTRPGRH